MIQNMSGFPVRRRVFIADMQLLVAAISFGLGFLGQRGAVLSGIKPLVCTAARFCISTFLLIAVSPILPQSFKSLKHGAPSDPLRHTSARQEKDVPSLFELPLPKSLSVGIYWGLILG